MDYAARFHRADNLVHDELLGPRTQIVQELLRYRRGAVRLCDFPAQIYRYERLFYRPRRVHGRTGDNARLGHTQKNGLFGKPYRPAFKGPRRARPRRVPRNGTHPRNVRHAADSQHNSKRRRGGIIKFGVMRCFRVVGTAAQTKHKSQITKHK